MDKETTAITDPQTEVTDFNVFQSFAKCQTMDKANELRGNSVSDLHFIFCELCIL